MQLGDPHYTLYVRHTKTQVSLTASCTQWYRRDLVRGWHKTACHT